MDFALIAFIFEKFLLFFSIDRHFGMKTEKHKKTKTKDFPFYDGVWTKSKIVYTVYPEHLELFVPSTRVEIQEKQKSKKSGITRYASALFTTDLEFCARDKKREG